MAADDCAELLANPTRHRCRCPMGRRRRPTYHANLLALWDHWVVEVPDAGGVHAIVFRIGEAEAVAREAIATVLDIDPTSFSVIVQPS